MSRTGHFNDQRETAVKKVKKYEGLGTSHFQNEESGVYVDIVHCTRL